MRPSWVKPFLRPLRARCGINALRQVSRSWVGSRAGTPRAHGSGRTLRRLGPRHSFVRHGHLYGPVGILKNRCLRGSFVLSGRSRVTAVEFVNDLSAVLVGTSFLELTYDNIRSNPFHSTDTRMAELRALAPALSLRDWADGLGVTKQAIRNWVATEPRERPELDDAMTALRAASIRHSDVSRWLRTRLPGSDHSPLDLMRSGRWRALRAATRLKPAIRIVTPPTPTMRAEARGRRAVSRQLGGRDAPPAPDDEE